MTSKANASAVKKALAKKNERSSNWCFTLNNYSSGEEEHLKSLQEDGTLKYLIYQHEIGAECGTPHLQGTLVLIAQKTMSSMKLLLGPRYHLEVTRDLPASIDYCEKAETRDPAFPFLVEMGSRPVTQQQKGKMEKDRWANALELVKAGRMDEVDPQLQIQHIRNLEHMEHRWRRKQKLEDTFEKNLWFVGPTGTGKSRLARESFPDAYIKNMNKWWCGYESETHVIIEEVQPGQATEGIIGMMKAWFDHYPFNGEVKQSSMKMRPKVLIVTSNYYPEEIFLREQDLQPMLRRVDVYEFSVHNPPKLRENPSDPVPGQVRTWNPPPATPVGRPLPAVPIAGLLPPTPPKLKRQRAVTFDDATPVREPPRKIPPTSDSQLVELSCSETEGEEEDDWSEEEDI